VWKNAWIVAGVVVLAVVLALGRSSLQSQIWASQASVRVLNAASTSVLPDQNRVDPAREVEIQRLAASSAAIAATATSRLGPDAGRISSVTITGDLTADAVQFEVQSGSKAVAQRGAQTYADVFVETQRRNIADLTKGQTDKLNADATDISNQIAGIDKRLAEIAPPVVVDIKGVPLLPPESEESKSLRANRQALATRLSDTQKQAQQLEVDSSERQGAIAVVAPAERPKDPVQPLPFRDAIIATALGLFLGLGLALARTQFDDRIRSADDVEELVPRGVGAVGIPHNDSHTQDGQEVIVPVDERRSQEREAYRALRTTLLFGRHDEQPARRVLVCSPNQGDGKTTTAANLALSMANSGRRVVLVDCDLRRPRIHAVFGVPNDVGLVSVVRDGVSLQTALRRVDLPESQHLDVLPAGPISHNPAELLMSTTVAAILAKLAERYDCVIIDSSPLRAVADALPLATLAEGVVLVARSRKTRGREVADAVAQLDQVSAHFLAVVVTQVRSKDGQYASYYGYYGPDANDGKASKAAKAPARRQAVAPKAGTSRIRIPERESKGR